MVENQELLNRHLSSYCEQFQCFLFKQGRKWLYFCWRDRRTFLEKISGNFQLKIAICG